MNALGGATHKEKEKKLGKKEEQCKHMWSKEGIKYFKRAETEWIGVYKDEK